MENIEKRLVAFQIGGRHGQRPRGNGANLTFLDVDKPITDYTGDLNIDFENYSDYLEKIGDRPNLISLLQEAESNPEAEARLKNWGFNLGEKIYVDATNGRPVGLTLTEAASGVGAINLDNQYDTTYVIHLGDCDVNELTAIIEGFKFNNFVDDAVLKYCKTRLAEERRRGNGLAHAHSL